MRGGSGGLGVGFGGGGTGLGAGLGTTGTGSGSGCLTGSTGVMVSGSDNAADWAGLGCGASSTWRVVGSGVSGAVKFSTGNCINSMTWNAIDATMAQPMLCWFAGAGAERAIATKVVDELLYVVKAGHY